MFEISKDFTGGNIEVISISENEAVLKKELRDTGEEWFYWAFCVRGAQGKTIKFDICDNYIGPFGPAVSEDNRNWRWLNKKDSDHSFTYEFSKDENCVYFAHSMLYHPDRFYDFCSKRDIKIKKIEDSNIPYITFGEGEEYIFLTARHHACESTGSYVLEGVLDELIKRPIENLKVICVPFVDFDGVCAGDQGKGRLPHDHNRDYDEKEEPLYKSVKFIREFAKTHKIKYAFDFHAPYHRGGINDYTFIVQKNYPQLKNINRFAALLEKENENNSFEYRAKNTIFPDVLWNRAHAPCFGAYMCDMAGALMSFTLETCYFGQSDGAFEDDKAVKLGKNFALALKKFEKEDETVITVTGDFLYHEPLNKMCENKGELGYREVIFDALPALLNTSWLVVNPETVFSKDDAYTFERYCFNTPLCALEALKKSGADLLCFANNHVMDRGENAILNTISACEDYGLDYIGIAKSKEEREKIFVKNIGGINVAFVNYTYGTNAFSHHNYLSDGKGYLVNLMQPEEESGYATDLLQDLDKIQNDVKKIYTPETESEKTYLHNMENDIKRAKAAADFVIAILHTGGQYNTEPDAFSKLMVSRAVGAGAGCVLANHAHIILSSEFKDGVFCAYGYGNFMSRLCGKCEIDPNYSAAVKIRLKKDKDNKIMPEISFVLCKNDIKDDKLSVKDTYDIYKESGGDEEIKKEILFYANRFAGAKKYDSVQKEYFIN